MLKKHKEELEGLLIEFTMSDTGKLVMKMDSKFHVVGMVQWLLEEKRIILNHKSKTRR
tara:strand:- start:675 stop:848 length:174 start_codon:yes stop_codon:yes gene_type:complete